MSILQTGVSRSQIRESALKPFGVTGEPLNIKRQQLVSLALGGRKFFHPFLVCPLPTEASGLLGLDFLKKTGEEISFETGNFALCTTNEEPISCEFTQVERAALSVS